MKLKRLVLFDIDETLIDSVSTGKKALEKALAETVGISSIKVPMSGKTDPQILQEVLAASGYSQDYQTHCNDLFKIYLAALEEEIAISTTYKIHSGVLELLEQLKAHPQISLGLLTGNIERGARLKLNKFDLNKYFPMGAYGSDSANRLDLPAIAKERASDHYKINFTPREIVIIGDAINDVLCAKHYGTVSLAVNTGKTTKEELEAHAPDYLFSSLENSSQVLEAILA